MANQARKMALETYKATYMEEVHQAQVVKVLDAKGEIIKIINE